MSKTLKCALAITSIAASSSSNGQGLLRTDLLGTNLLICNRSDGLSKYGCNVSQHMFISNVPYELVFTPSYVFNCSGHRLQFSIATSSGGHPLQITVSEKKVQQPLLGRELFISNDDPTRNERAKVIPECELKVTKVDYDLAPSSIRLLDNHLQSMKVMNNILAITKSIEILGTSIRSLMNQIDIATLKGLLLSLRANCESLKTSYAGEPIASEAIQDILSLIDTYISANPPLNDEAGTEVLRKNVLETLDLLSKTAETLTYSASNEVAHHYLSGIEILTYASEETRKLKLPSFEAENRRAKD